jgi:hypothetical protein
MLAALGALVSMTTGGAQAEVAPGDALNPSGSDPTRNIDPRGMSHLRSVRSRSPAGFLYPDPWQPRPWFDLGEGWSIRGAIEVGGEWTEGDDKRDDQEARFGQYADWKDRAIVEYTDLTIVHEPSRFAGDFAAGRIAADDQHYRLDLGIPGLFSFRGSYSGVPHVFATDAKSLYAGAGTDVLKFKPPLGPGFIPADVANADISAALARTSESTLSIQRDRTRLQLEFKPLDSLTLFGRYGLDETDGERPFGGSLLFAFFGSDPARVVETIEPRNHRTHDFAAGLRYRGTSAFANLEYNGSLFRNSDSSLTWDNPFELVGFGDPGSIERGRFALTPDNDRHNIKADASLSLPWNGRLTGTASWSRMRQNDDLIAATVNTTGEVGAGPNRFRLDQWASTDVLDRSKADARVDTLLLNARVQFRPIKPLRIQASARYYDLDNDTRYTALNQQTGEFGYVAEDGAHAVLTPFSRTFRPGEPNPPTDDFRYRSSPYDYRKIETELNTEYRVAKKTLVGGRYRYEQIDRNAREREETQEHQARLSVTSRDLRWATLRGSYEYRDRDGDGYEYFPNRNDYVSRLDGFNPFLGARPSTLAQLRRFDVADRKRHDAKLSANFLPRDDLDLSVSARFADDDYGAQYGLKEERRWNVSADLGFQPSPNAHVYAFGYYEDRQSRLAGINDTPFVASDDPNAGGPIFPFDNSWTLDTDGTTGSAGTGVRVQLHPKVEVDLHYAFISSREEHHFDISGAGALATGLTEARDLPDLRRQDHNVGASLRISIVEHAALRFFYRFERSTISDFSQRGLASETLVQNSGALFLGHVDHDFTAHLFGMTLQARF